MVIVSGTCASVTDPTSSVKLYDGFVAAFAQAKIVGSVSAIHEIILPVVTHEASPDASETRTLLRPGDHPRIWIVPPRRVLPETLRLLLM